MKGTADRTGQEDLSERLHGATGADRAAAEATPFLAALLAGRLPRPAYAALLAQQFFVYEAIEQAAIAMRDDPVAGLFVFGELTRLPELLADLEFLLGADWADRLEAVPATVAYCERLQEVAFTWPAGFVAHHHTRYLGDLSLGRQIGPAVQRAYGLTRNGRRGFAFEGIDPDAFRAQYCDLLDAVSWDAAEQDRFLTEAAQATRLTATVLTHLGHRHLPTPAR